MLEHPVYPVLPQQHTEEAVMPRYRLTCETARFYEDVPTATREFDAPKDDAAIYAAENPAVPLKIVVPGVGAVNAAPRELVDLTTSPPRVVKKW
ncbi:MAG: hypothetical protein HYT40_01585 [Candidatus Sungbacteria bacterium]|uniref:Uncharacterized protein n=1 Tax=Candidatus Sungiibacteriota bacterium TaxID=2750080 RepID=A0A931SD10_9BACT|nr:hypothetical protein [Candidatus Sungbacteria bacterium]